MNLRMRLERGIKLKANNDKMRTDNIFLKTERVVMLVIYKENGSISAHVPEHSLNGYELLGFLEAYLQMLKDDMQQELEKDY